MDATIKSYPFTRGDLLSLTGSIPAKLATSAITSAEGTIRHPRNLSLVYPLAVTLDPYVDDNTDRNIVIECDPAITATWPDGQMLAKVHFLGAPPLRVSSGPFFVDVRG